MLLGMEDATIQGEIAVENPVGVRVPPSASKWPMMDATVKEKEHKLKNPHKQRPLDEEEGVPYKDIRLES